MCNKTATWRVSLDSERCQAQQSAVAGRCQVYSAEVLVRTINYRQNGLASSVCICIEVFVRHHYRSAGWIKSQRLSRPLGKTSLVTTNSWILYGGNFQPRNRQFGRVKTLPRINCHLNFLERLRNRVALYNQALHTDAAPQHPMSHNSLHQWMFCRKKNFCGSPAPPLFSGSQYLWIIFPLLKNNLKGHHLGTLDNIQKSITRKIKGIRKLLWKKGTVLPLLCSCPRKLLRRG